MIDSLFDLIAAIFIASLPVLLAIGRGRRAIARRRSARGQGRRGSKAPSSADTTERGSAGAGRRSPAEARTASSRTSSSGASSSGAATDTKEVGGDTRHDSPRGRWRRRGVEIFRRFWHGSSGVPAEETSREGPKGGAGAPAAGTQTVRRKRPEEHTILESVAPEEVAEGPRGAEALMERVNRYPPLQRAIVLKEILDNPKGLE